MALYEAGYNNAAWASQMQQSALASDRLRGNAFFPHAARQVAEADAIAGGRPMSGAIPGLYGNPAARVTPRPVAQPTLASYYKKSLDEYKAASDKHNADVLGGHDARYDLAASMLTGKGPPTEQEIQLQRDKRLAEARLVEQGVSASSLANEKAGDFQRASESLDFNKRLQVMDRLSGLSGDKLRTMENSRLTPPDISPLLDIEQMRGAGTTEGLPVGNGMVPIGGDANGLPAMYGNPYGVMPEGGGGQQPVYGVGYGQTRRQTEKDLRRAHSYKVSRGEVPAESSPIPLRPAANTAAPIAPPKQQGLYGDYGNSLWRRATAPMRGMYG
jgi:hypothetical protein